MGNINDFRAAFDEAIAAVDGGSLSALARKIDVPKQTLSNYRKNGLCLGDTALRIERATGVNKSRLNPVLYPAE